jgi:hypothetical protein
MSEISDELTEKQILWGTLRACPTGVCMEQRFILRLISATAQGEFIPVRYAVTGRGEEEMC